MSQPRRLVRARQLTASVLPGRKADGNPDQAATRLLKLAQGGSTGTLPFSGRSEVKGSLAASSDGLVIAHDLTDIEPTQVAAIAAATLGLASRATLATGCGTFREAVSRGTDGYLAVYAAGDSTIVAVVGTSSLNVGMLQFRSREIIERIAACMAKRGPRTSRPRAAETRPAETRPAETSAASAEPASAASPRSAQPAPASRADLPSRRAARP